MAVASVGTPAITNTATTGTLAMAWGTGQTRTAGNVLVIAVCAAAVTSTTAISTPAGWTKLTEITAGINRLAWYWLLAAGGDTAPTFTSTLSGVGGMAGVPFELSGANTTTPIATQGSNTTVTTTTLASGTTAGNVPSTGCLGLAAFSPFTSVAATRTWTPGSGWTNVASTVAVSQRYGLIVDSNASLTSGATASESGTFSTTPTNESCEIIVVQPAAAASAISFPIMAPMTGA